MDAHFLVFFSVGLVPMSGALCGVVYVPRVISPPPSLLRPSSASAGACRACHGPPGPCVRVADGRSRPAVTIQRTPPYCRYSMASRPRPRPKGVTQHVHRRTPRDQFSKTTSQVRIHILWAWGAIWFKLFKSQKWYFVHIAQIFEIVVPLHKRPKVIRSEAEISLSLHQLACDLGEYLHRPP